MALPAQLAPPPATPTSAVRHPEQRSLSHLSSFKEVDIIAWLRLLRSIEASENNRPGNDHLSRSQLHALRWLSSLPSNQIGEWLRQRQTRFFDAQEEQQTNNNTSAKPWIFTDPGTATDETASFHEYSKFEDETILGYDRSHPMSPESPLHLAPPSSSTMYWSTAQDSPQRFTTFDGFRRHENERERYYELLPHGLIEASAQGPLCAFCLYLDPDEKHFEMHNALNLMENTPSMKRRSRKENFRRLLRTHMISDEHIDRLVKKWHFTVKKQAYSCGLCVKLFSTLLERTNHLAHDHYERGESRDGWDATTLIRGLLLQLDINEAFQKRYAMDPSNPNSRLTWTSSTARVLRERLESRRENPRVLAQAAFDTADPSNVTAEWEDHAAVADQTPNQVAPSSSPPAPLNDGAISSTHLTDQATGIQFPDSRILDGTDSAGYWTKDENSPLHAWAPSAGATAAWEPAGPMAGPHTPLELTGNRRQNLFQNDANQGPLMGCTSQYETTGDQGLGIYTPTGFPESIISDHDAASSSNAVWEQNSWLPTHTPWPQADHDEDLRVTTQAPSTNFSTLKRKEHPVNAARASSNKPFMMSPDEDYPPSVRRHPSYDED